MLKKILLGATILAATMAFGHGEDKPGPNGGFIRMPGAFHTEIIPLNKNTLKVYLLDIEWKNPTVANSSVKLRINKTEAQCDKKPDHYACNFPKSIDIKNKGKLTVEAVRENAKGNVVSYDLPLKLQVVDDGHGAHH